MGESEGESPTEDVGAAPMDIEAEAGVDKASGETDIAIPFLILTATSGWALRHTDTSTYYAFGAFAFAISHGVFGTFQYAHADAEKFENVYYNSLILTMPMVLPLTNSELYRKSDYNPLFGYFFTATGLIPLLVDLYEENLTDKAVQGVYIFNLGALIYYIATEQQNSWIYGLAAASTCSAIALQFRDKLNNYLPAAIAIGLSCFNITVVYSLAEQ